MKYFLLFICLLISPMSFSQKDSLKLGDRYLEDQLYFNVTYNIFTNQLKDIGESGFSFGLSAGYIRDIPFNRRGNYAAGIGLGYNYDTFKHSMLAKSDGNFFMDKNATSNKIRLHNIELPIQLRWRDSDAVTYSFWRVYAGVRLSYNILNIFKYTLNGNDYNFDNLSSYNKFQSGLELSAGYGSVNAFIYYGLTPIYKNATINGRNINTKIIKIGLIFYLL